MPLISSNRPYQSILNWLWNDSWTDHLLMTAELALSLYNWFMKANSKKYRWNPPNIFSTDPEMSPKLFLSMIISYKKVFKMHSEYFWSYFIWKICSWLTIIWQLSQKSPQMICLTFFLSFFFLTANWRVVVAGKDSF